MTRTIYKYPLLMTDLQAIEMPVGYEILCVQVQNDIPCIWALVDPGYSTTKVMIATFGTGHNITENYKIKYIGTYQFKYVSIVFHVFEV